MKNLFAKNKSPEALKQKAWLNLVVFLVTVLINYLASSGLFGISQKSVSAAHPTLITPAGYAFSIWGLIYLLLLVALGFNAYQPTAKNHEHFNRKNSILFLLSCGLNIVWTFSFLFKWFTVSAVCILALAIVLAYILEQIIKHQQSIWLRLGFSFYAAWVLIASVINVGVVILDKAGSEAFKSEAMIAIITLVVATVLACLISLRIKSLLYVLPLIWAYIAIFFRQENYAIKVASLALSLVLLAFLIWRIIDQRQEIKAHFKKQKTS
ncbi:MAG: TspO/MBR family protein [Eubacteriales bacterium]|nr:TspO/MBR family protein [Eubacteriales bacterium]